MIYLVPDKSCDEFLTNNHCKSFKTHFNSNIESFECFKLKHNKVVQNINTYLLLC